MLIDADLPEGISMAILEGWYDRFRFYRHSPSKVEILGWIKQFAPQHHGLARRLLDNVILISDLQIQQGYREALAALDGWSKIDTQRRGRWAFVGLGGQAESGPAMLHMFREANGLESDRHQGLFVTPADLPKLRLTARDTVIFVDDFSGTGDQFSSRWTVYRELVSSEARTYLFLAAATSVAMSRLSELDEIEIRATRTLGSEANVFSPNSPFDDSEKTAILGYGKRADRKQPKGWGDCGLLLVISRKTPNNSVPILHSDSRRWKSIFPRRLKTAQSSSEVG